MLELVERHERSTTEPTHAVEPRHGPGLRPEQSVDGELATQLLAADATRTRMILIASALALLTVPLALLFTYWINQPIRQLEQVIRQLGSARAEGPIRIQGPREMQVLGRQLSWLRDQLAELDAQKQQFLRHISHELKTPLASLCEGADLLAEGVVGPALNPAQPGTSTSA